MKLFTPENLHRMERFLWAATLVTIPVTSFRYMPFMGADSQVKPLAFIPAFLLLVVLGIRSLQQRRILFWNNSLLPLLGFVLVAIFTSAAGFLLSPPDLYNYSYASRLLRAWITLSVGLVFLIVPISMNHDEQDLRFTLEWLFVGLGVHLLWSMLQLFQFYVLEEYFYAQPIGNLVDQIQKTMMMAGLSPNRRISGLALEPSWLAAQVISIYLPWAFASVLSGHSWVRRRWLPTACLVVCAGLILFTYSRSGILTGAGVMLLTFFITGWSWFKKAWTWFWQPFHPYSGNSAQQVLKVSLRFAMVVLILAGLAGGFRVLSKNQYFAQLWQADKKDLTSYFVDIYAGPRLAYAFAGWTIFTQHPWTGVGMGGLGLHFYQALPDWAHFKIPEVSHLLSSVNQTYPNTKDLYVRLLAETGIVGFWLFLSFYFLLLAKIIPLLRSRKKELLFVGIASLMTWLGILTAGVTQDSFAMLNIWLPLGMIIGMADHQP